MLLVDSSVWIDIHHAVTTDATKFLAANEERDEIATTGIIVQEVLQGVRSEAFFAGVLDLFWRMLVVQPRELATHELAAQLYRRATDSGLLVRKSSSCLVAALGLEHDAIVVHNDEDFVSIQKIEPSLMVFPPRKR